MVYRSKIDPWLFLVLAAAAMYPLLLAIPALRSRENWLPHLLVFGILGGLFSWMLLSTKYTVSGDTLLVQSGPFRWRISKNEITGIVPSKSMLSSPALSLDRLRIEYAGGRRSILISPKNKDGFLKAIAVTENAV